MALNFGGLATGLDTNAIVNELMQLERRPLTRLQTDKSWNNSRLAALDKFNSKLEGFLSKIEDLDSSADLQARKTTLSSKDFFSASAESAALRGNYQVEVVSLAQVEKEVSQGYADKTAGDFGTGKILLTVGDADPFEITINAENNSLEGIMQAINTAGAGVSAALINDGTVNPHRLVLTADEVAQAVTFDSSGLTGGTYANPTFTQTQTGQQAHIRVDGIDIYSSANSIEEAIPGVTLNLTKAELGTNTTLTVDSDEAAIKKKVQAFVSGYNEVVSFVTQQSSIDGSSGGILRGDSGLNSIKRHLQNMLVSAVDNDGSLKTLSQLGIETQRDGTVKLDDETLTKVIDENLDGLAGLLAGDGEIKGIATQVKDYLESVTHTTDGFYTGRKQSIDSNIKRIDKSIEQINVRLEQREKSLRDQFNALEQLVSGMNAQSTFLSQQMTMLNNMWSQKQ
ncbi:MAG TPA: flagellar filament capping protein FliD [Desulfuromonadales bacterium]|nr:flagellar filament capping protein FliD [Desulfuromonadales bacterium]